MGKEGRFVLTGVVLLFILASVIGLAGAAESEAFSVDSVLLKLSLAKGDFVNKTITITSPQGGQFSIEVLGIEEAILNQGSFVMQPGQEAKIAISLDSWGLKEGIYAGSIKISHPKKVLYIPIIIEVESVDVFFDASLNIAPEYNKIARGENLVADIKILDLVSGSTKNGLGASSINMEYYIYDLNGNAIVFESESISVDGKLQYTKTISIPKDVKEGDYVLGVVTRYAGSAGTSSYLFSVGKKASSGIFGAGTNALAIAIIIAVLVGVLAIVLYSMKGQNKLISELERYHVQELREQKKLLLAQARVMRQKGVSRGYIRKEIRRKVHALKKKHKARKRELAVLRKQGKTEEMKKKLNQWKKEGFYTLEMGSRLGKLGTKEMKRIMENWKKKYGVHQ